MSHRILLVEDDPALAQSVYKGLRGEGFDVVLVQEGDRASQIVQREEFDLIVLDLMLPGRSGEELLTEWQARLSVPVIVLTARTELHDRLRCFSLGAADYLPKPFWMEELLARVNARLRIVREAPARLLCWREICVDLDARTAHRDGEELGLTRNEFNVLAYLLERAGRAVSRAQIADGALTPGEELNPRTVDGYIARLRVRLGEDAGAAIETVWGIGYRFRREELLDAPEKDEN
ncbi:MAG: response regulator transcription factor [Myxococcales bacterium]|nr:response regulator transcription factor [Myxococcales bacterium]